MFIAVRKRKISISVEYSSIRVEDVAGALAIHGWRLDDKGNRESVTITLNGNEIRLINERNPRR